jgi:hypothetical protein
MSVVDIKKTVPKTRRLPNFIEAYIELLRDTPGSELFKIWSALWCISAAVERKLWVTTMGKAVYPNIYVLLIGSSGAGKGTSMPTARDLVYGLGDNRLGASSMTAAFVGWALKGNERQFINPLTHKAETYHALNVFSPELGVLFHVYDTEILNRLTDMWDCGPYSEGRKDETKTFFCEKSCTTMLMGTTETHLLTTFPQTAWSTGFMSRTVMVHSSPQKRRSLFVNMDPKTRANTFEALKVDLKIISLMTGEYVFTEGAARLLDEFYTFPGNLGGPPIPDHPNLLSYCERRHMQIEKMMILFAAAEGPDLLLTEEHFHLAHDLLIETEAGMPDVFKTVVEGSDLDKANKIMHLLWKAYLKNMKRPIPAGAVEKACMKDTTIYHAQQLFEMLKRTKHLNRAQLHEMNDEEKARGIEHYIPSGPEFMKG